MNPRRISRRFEELASKEQSGFIAYITAGDPSPDATLVIAHALESAGVDLLELGIPFSDPLADGPTIQAASNRALAAGMTVARSLEIVGRFRADSELPIVLFTYLNPIYAYGFEKFLTHAAAAGADGLLILDLPPDEAEQDTTLDLVRRSRSDSPGCAHDPFRAHGENRFDRERVCLLRFSRGSNWRAEPPGRHYFRASRRAAPPYNAAHCRRIRNLNHRAGCDGRKPSGCGRCWERNRQAHLRKRHSA